MHIRARVLDSGLRRNDVGFVLRRKVVAPRGVVPAKAGTQRVSRECRPPESLAFEHRIYASTHPAPPYGERHPAIGRRCTDARGSLNPAVRGDLRAPAGRLTGRD